MKPIPETEESLVLRTDFSDGAAWEALCAAVVTIHGEFRAYVAFVSGREYEGATLDQLVPLATELADRSFMFVVDGVSLSHEEHAILVVDLLHEPGRSFRVIPSEMWSVENNLSLARDPYVCRAWRLDEGAAPPYVDFGSAAFVMSLDRPTVTRCSSRCEAELLVREFEMRGHKQLYWMDGPTRNT